MAEPPAPHGLGHLPDPGLSDPPRVALEEQQRQEHHEESAERQQVGHRQQPDHQHHAGQQPESGPLDVAERVGVDGGLGHLAGQFRVALVEVVLYLAEDALFVL